MRGIFDAPRRVTVEAVCHIPSVRVWALYAVCCLCCTLMCVQVVARRFVHTYTHVEANYSRSIYSPTPLTP